MPAAAWTALFPATKPLALSVADTGEGISETDRERLFEPFFTKKVMGRSGTGLGLTIVWKTVKNHNGYIDISTGANGTCFTLHFPVAPCETTPVTSETEPVADLQGKGRRILVVDDDPLQIEVAVGILRRLDYVVETAVSGEAAVERVTQAPFDLVVLDMIMPGGMNGRETFEALLGIQPGIRALIVSGYAETMEVKKAQSLGAKGFLRKPYTLTELGRMVARALAAGS